MKVWVVYIIRVLTQMDVKWEGTWPYKGHILYPFVFNALLKNRKKNTQEIVSLGEFDSVETP